MKTLDRLNKIASALLLVCTMATGTHRAVAQIINTFAGNGTGGYSLDGVPATSTKLNQPIAVAVDRSGNVYVADVGNARIRMVDASGVISTFAGNGGVGYSGDGSAATAAHLMGPAGVCVDRAGNVYISDAGTNHVRKVNTSGIISTIAGNGVPGYLGDGGAATDARLNNIKGLTVDGWGNVYIADYNNSCIRKVDTLGFISTFAGTGTAGSGGDGGPATMAKLNYPADVAVDKTGNVYIADLANSRVRKVDTAGIITTFAGGGGSYPGYGGLATAAHVYPNSLAIDWWGNVYISEFTVSRVCMVDTSGIIHSVAGNGTAGFSGDSGPATSAELNSLYGVAVDGCGNVYAADVNNNRVREVTYPPVYTIPSISLTGISSAPAGTTVTVNATVSNAGSSYDIYWYNDGLLFATTTTPVTTYTKGTGTDTITALIVPTSYGCWDSTTSAQHLISNESLGVNAMSGGQGIIISPNPAGMSVSVKVTADMASGNVTVYDLVGRAVINEALKGKETMLNISGLPSGVYIVTVTDGAAKRAVARLVKE